VNSVAQQPRQTQQKGAYQEVENLSKFFLGGVTGAVAYLQVSPLGGSRGETWRGQGIRKRCLSWNLTKLSQLWRCNGGFGPCTAQNHLRREQFVSLSPSLDMPPPPPRDRPGCCTAEVGNFGGTYELPCIDMNFFLVFFLWGTSCWSFSKHLSTPCILTTRLWPFKAYRFIIQKFYVLPTDYICEFCV
jgi:hypothetical protein